MLPRAPGPMDRPSAAGSGTSSAEAAGPEAPDDVHCSTNAWIYCAFIEPETPQERNAWLAAMPAGCDAVSPIRRPREFARALGAMAAEQIGPRGRPVLLRNTADGQTFCTAHRQQVVYHGPVAYSEDPWRRLEQASSVLEFALLLVFMKDAVHRAQREYRFAVWSGGGTAQGPGGPEDLASAGRGDAEGAAGARGQRVRAGPGPRNRRSWRKPGGPGASSERLYVEALPAFAGGRRAVAPQHYVVDRLPGDVLETAVARVAVEALRAAVDGLEAGRRQQAAAAAWHAEPVVRFLCSAFEVGIADVRVSEENFIVLTGALSGDAPVEVAIAVGPDGSCACRMSTGGVDMACTAPDVRSFGQVLKVRFAEVGVHGRGGVDP